MFGNTESSYTQNLTIFCSFVFKGLCLNLFNAIFTYKLWTMSGALCGAVLSHM